MVAWLKQSQDASEFGSCLKQSAEEMPAKFYTSRPNSETNRAL